MLVATPLFWTSSAIFDCPTSVKTVAINRCSRESHVVHSFVRPSVSRIDRRNVLTLAAAVALASVIPAIPGMFPVPSLSPIMAARMRAMRDALAALEVAPKALESDAVAYARDCVENALLTPTACAADEDAVLMALDAYEEIHPSAFAMQTARDLFTPRRYQTYPLARLRHWLLTDPDEDFAKSGMPGFLRTMRERHRALAMSA